MPETLRVGRIEFGAPREPVYGTEGIGLSSFRIMPAEQPAQPKDPVLTAAGSHLTYVTREFGDWYLHCGCGYVSTPCALRIDAERERCPVAEAEMVRLRNVNLYAERAAAAIAAGYVD